MHSSLREELAKISVLAKHHINKGNRVTPITVGAGGPNDPSSTGTGSCSPLSAMGGASSARDVMGFLSALGAVPCRVWGATIPGPVDPKTGCPIGKKLCGMMYPLYHSVPASATNEPYPIKAKNWYWPLLFVDGGTPTDVTLVNLEYQGDPVGENGDGVGPIQPAGLFAQTGNYSFMPGLPAFNDQTPLVHYFANADAANAEAFRGMYIGISIRN
jgi:hypothetical protein